MTRLPPALEGFAGFLDAQPEAVRGIFYYCLCLMMVETEKMRLVETTAGDGGEICTFKSVEGERFAVPRPAIGPDEEKAVLVALREILREDGLL